MLNWFATKLLPKKLRKHFITTSPPTKPSAFKDATGNYSAAFVVHPADQFETPVPTPTGLPDISNTFRQTSASNTTPHATPGPQAAKRDAASGFAFQRSAADAGLDTPEASCTGRDTPLLAGAVSHCSCSGSRTPTPTLTGALDPTPSMSRTKRYLVADGKTIGYANTFRKNAEDRPVQLHETPFEHLIDKELALEMRAAQAALEVQQQAPRVSDSAQKSLLAGADGGVVMHTPQMRMLRQMR